jgi:hypothetical protein
MTKEYILTDEMRNLFPVYVQRFTALCLRTMDPDEEFDWQFAVKATTNLFKIAGIEPPKNFFIGTWPACVAEARRINTTIDRAIDPKATENKEVSSALGWGCYSAAAAGFAEFFVQELGADELKEKRDVIMDVTLGSGPTLLFNEAAFISYFPTEIIKGENDSLTPRWDQPEGLHGWMVGNPDELIDFCVANKRKAAKKRHR